MARKRMINQDVIDTDIFVSMSINARYLYFELLIRCDDDGFTGKAARITRSVDCTKEDFSELERNGFIIRFESGITVITDWKTHNRIRRDMYRPTVYQEEFARVEEREGRYYVVNSVHKRNDYVTDTVQDCNRDVTDTVRERPSRLELELESELELVDNKNLGIDKNLGDCIIVQSKKKPDIKKQSQGENCPANCGQVTTKRPLDVRLSDNLSGDKDNARDIRSLGKTPTTGIKIPLKDGSHYDVPVEKVEQWREAFQAVDIEAELRRMCAWCADNPKRRKTRRGVTRFINAWLGEEQDKGGRYNGSAVTGKSGEEVWEPDYLKIPRTPTAEDPFQ